MAKRPTQRGFLLARLFEMFSDQQHETGPMEEAGAMAVDCSRMQLAGAALATSQVSSETPRARVTMHIRPAAQLGAAHSTLP